MRNFRCFPSLHRDVVVAVVVAGFAVASSAGCGGAGESESKMTSYSAGQAKERHRRTLYRAARSDGARAGGAGAEIAIAARTASDRHGGLQRFQHDAGVHRGRRAGAGNTCRARADGAAGQTLLTVSSPDYSAARSAYLKARSVQLLAEKIYSALRICMRTKRSPRRICSRRNRIAAAQADLQSSEDALRALGLKDPEGLSKNRRKQLGNSGARARRRGDCGAAGGARAVVAGGRDAVLHDFGYEQGLGAGQRLPERSGIRARRRHGGHHNRRLSELFHGKISYVAPALDPTTRTLQARIETENPGDKLKKDMYVTATVHAGAIANAHPGARRSRPARHRESAVRLRRRPGSNQFARRPVTLGDTRTASTQIAAA